MAKQLQILDPDFKLPDNYEDLVKVYRKAAKAADQRMVRLEQLSQEENYKSADKYAYAKAQRAIREWSGEQATRFNTKPPASTSALKEKIQDIKSFLGSSSSTKTGLKNVHMSRAKSLNERYGTNYTWQQWDTFLNSEFMKKLDKDYGYNSKDAVIGTVMRNRDEIIDQLEEANEIEIYTTDDEMANEVVNTILNEYSDDIKEALGFTGTKSKKTKNQKNRKRKRK